MSRDDPFLMPDGAESTDPGPGLPRCGHARQGTLRDQGGPILTPEEAEPAHAGPWLPD